MKPLKMLFAFIIIALVFTSMNSGYAQQTFAKLGMTLAAGHPTQKVLTHFRDSFDEQLTLQIFPDAQLGSAQQILEGLQFGDIEMGILPLESVSRHAPGLDVLGLPYLFKDASHRAKVLDGPLGKRFLEGLDELNLVGLGFLETCPRFYITKDRPLNTPEAFQNRVTAIICPLSDNECRNQTYEQNLDILNLMGAHATIIPLATLEEAFESEKPDAVEYLPFIGMDKQFKSSEFTTLTLPAHRTLPSILVAGKRWFDTLPPQTRKAIARASNTLVRQQKHAMKEALRHEYEMLEAQGITIAEEEHTSLHELANTLYKENSEKLGPEFEQFFHAVQKIRRGME